MKRWGWAVLALVGLGLPLAALSESNPQVTLATPGTGGINGGAINRYTLRFSEAMVPLGDPRAKPPAKLTCDVPATGRWADQQTWVYEFERPLPGGISCTIRLNDGLASARGADVTGTTAFTIDTGGPSARAMLPQEGNDIEEDQVFLVATNTPASPASVAANGYCAVDGIGDRIPLDVLGNATALKLLTDLGEEDWDSRNFLENAGLPRSVSTDPTERARALATVSAVKCRRPLPPGKDVAVVWGANIAGAGGRLAGRDQRFDFSVRKAFTARFECRRVNPQAGCNPVEDASIRFTADVPVAKALAARLIGADGKAVAASLHSDDKGSSTVSRVYFRAPLPIGGDVRVELPAGVIDESGRALANAQRFPLAVRVDAAPPLVKFAADFGIIEAKEGGVLPVTVRAVEPQLAQGAKAVTGDMLRVDASDGEIAKWLRDIADAAESKSETRTIKGEEVEINTTGTRSLLKGAGGLKLDLPGKGKDFEVVGIPLKEPGFYVVELASPVLGQSLLGRATTRYVAAGALVTNMAVHFKWGRDRSLAWVTSLDSAAPMAGADVRVTDSCTGRQLARGTTDPAGRLVVSGLPEPVGGGSCASSSSEHALMVSARAGGDFSFTMTAWNDGIQPYDFDLPQGWSAQDDIIHTIFDRTLVRQGETINMKHIMRRPLGEGLGLAPGITGTLRLTHQGSDTSFDMPIAIGADGIGENSWVVPKGAPMGDYAMAIVRGKDNRIYLDQSFRVDEYRLPTMKATIAPPKEALVRPQQVPLDLFVGYLSGGGAANLPVSIRTAYDVRSARPDGWDDYSFGGRPISEGTIALSGSTDEPEPPLPMSQTLPVTLGSNGAGRAAIDITQPVDTDTVMTVEMDYQDANGETLTASRRIPLMPAGVRLGIKTDGWLMRDDDLRLRLVALSPDGAVVRGKAINVAVYSREVLTARRRLIGGFYAYDNQMRTKKLNAACATSTDKLGMAQCTLAPGVSGEVIVVATTIDSAGNVARAVRSVWLAGEDEWWFGGDNGDRMDIVPEAKSYKAGATARFQVRMPFRDATALVTVEREGVLSSFVTQLSGKDPVVSVPMPAAYAPDVFVSVLAVRGRVGGWKLWTAQIARDWGLPFLNADGYRPTATVDLAKPSYRLGMARVQVGWDGFRMGVKVKADKPRYAVRETAAVDVAVTDPSGKPARNAEIAFAAVDEALLQLSPNDSWDVLSAMMGERPNSVITSTAQMQIVGKRHYGRKAVQAGGGGGQDASAANRDDFRPVLLWRGRVPLDAKGKARIPVQLSESLSSFRLVAVANAGNGWFGTGETSVRTAQDLSIFSGLPPLVRTGDSYGASVTLRNTTTKPMKVMATAKVTPAIDGIAPQELTIPAGGAVPVTWDVTAPQAAGQLAWEIEAKSGKVVDRIALVQDVAPAVPVETWAATLLRVGAETRLPIAAPQDALPGVGYVDVRLSDTLAPPLTGVRDYMGNYPYSCFEQQTSRIVVLEDREHWAKLAAEIPAYLDSEGLLRYWPVADMRGSEALTAYVLSITAEAGLPIPDAAKARMLDAMKGVLDGRIRRDYAWGNDPRLTRIAALAALARNGRATPAMLGQVAMAPADMPTTTLADWIAIIDRTRGANVAVRTAAEAVLRQRLVYEGTRLDLTDKANAPWWMMSSGDEMALRALSVVIGRPGWSAEEPRMMVGAANRQQRGHWDTTTANAWGAVAVRKFARAYPATAITGMTTLALADATQTRNWPQGADAASLRFALPLTETPLVMKHAGPGPWATVSVAAAVPLKAPLFAGYRVTKTVSAIQQAVKGQWTRGDVIKVRIAVVAGVGRNWVVVSDPIIPGATVIGGLGGQSALLGAQANGGEGAWPSYTERGKDAWRAYFEWAPEGPFAVEYAVRLNGTGRFTLPPTRVEAMYSPEIRGQLPNAPVAVRMP